MRRSFPYCLACGTLRKGAKVQTFTAPVLQWGEPMTTVAVTERVITVGRTRDNDVVLDDDSVSRRHARIVREADGFHVEDFGSFNGTVVASRELRGSQAKLQDGTMISFCDVEVTFTQPRNTAIGSKTKVRGTEHTVLEATVGAPPQEAPMAGEPLSIRPRQRSGWALKQVQSSGGEPRWVLRNTRTGTYLSLDEREVFIWEHIDGENTMRDLLFAYLDRFGELALPRIEATVRTFADAELVRGLPDQNPSLTGWQKIRAFVVANLIRVQLSINNLDPLVERAYRAFVWRFFTPIAAVLLWALTLAGIYAFVQATDSQQLFDLAGAGPVGAAVVVAGYLVATAVHEAAHAFAVKSYGRRVNRGGFMLMIGFPFAFVDTSDMWFGTPYSRIMVAVSGPLSTAGIAGAASLTALYLPHPQIAGVCYTLAFGLYVNTLFNLIPLTRIRQRREARAAEAVVPV
ncbi:MAG: FHA domain-containing protein [Pseudonocardia sp.]